MLPRAIPFQLLWISFCCFLLYFFIFILGSNRYGGAGYINTNGAITCYTIKNAATLPDISEAKVRKGRSIFFHETSCTSFDRGNVMLPPRQACAVESAARLNPTMDVNVIFSSPSVFNFDGSETDHILQNLLTYPNINIYHVDSERYTRNTPAEELYERGRLVHDPKAQAHVRDVLKYLTLYKYGGIYVDLDMISIKSFEDMKPNFAGTTYEETVGASVLGLGDDEIGRAYASKCLEELGHQFSKSSEVSSTSEAITRVLNESCDAATISEMMLSQKCKYFKLFPTNAFYPLPKSKWRMYFEPYEILEVYEMARDSYTLKLWGELSNQYVVPVFTQTAYTQYLKRYCPKVYDRCGTVV